ncbi:hypothetical protein I7I51_05185 [Histoplasma capsulatum]|uniref:Uncharacterized protein n=1 Tax=Ajellomyces capsulatus TaxID=5037 RepID=A0A8A1M861_AJECA|nr:hypothetical protein I7I51_05185 [Histoplasma capsulatum]
MAGRIPHSNEKYVCKSPLSCLTIGPRGVTATEEVQNTLLADEAIWLPEQHQQILRFQTWWFVVKAHSTPWHVSRSELKFSSRVVLPSYSPHIGQESPLVSSHSRLFIRGMAITSPRTP